MKKDAFKIDEKIAIHCSTEELANKVLSIYHSLGYKWRSSDSLVDVNLWDIFVEDTCYILYPSGIMMDNINQCNRKIMEAQDFLELYDVYTKNNIPIDCSKCGQNEMDGKDCSECGLTLNVNELKNESILQKAEEIYKPNKKSFLRKLDVLLVILCVLLLLSILSAIFCEPTKHAQINFVLFILCTLLYHIEIRRGK